jgi:hypothetical protein
VRVEEFSGTVYRAACVGRLFSFLLRTGKNISAYYLNSLQTRTRFFSWCPMSTHAHFVVVPRQGVSVPGDKAVAVLSPLKLTNS